MTQFSMEDYLTDEEKLKLNIPIKKLIKENDENNDEQIIESNEIIEIKRGNEIYRFWKVEFIRPFIIKFLKEIHLNSVVYRELDLIDLTVINIDSDIIVPIEIQKTPIVNGKIGHSKFEDSIRRQLEGNLKNYGKCWFFMDFEYLRYLQNVKLSKSTNVNMTWIIQLMKEKDFKVFAIKYNGKVKELTTKDFDFLKKISNTYEVECDNDERILKRNKLKIFRDIVKGCKFTQEKIDNFYKEFDKCSDKIQSTEFFSESKDERCRLYGNIKQSIGNLYSINSILDMVYINNSNGKISKYKHHLVSIGIFDNVGTYGHGNLLKFTDKFDICKYFPGYLRNKDQWESYRNTNLNYDVFERIANGSYKNSKIMLDY